MQIIGDYFLKRVCTYALIALISAPGVVGVFVTLFPPDGAQLNLFGTLAGLFFSSFFLVTAWGIWKWSQSCVLCDTNHSTQDLYHQ